MKRRSFISHIAQSAITAAVIQGCSGINTANSRHLVATPEKRAEYLELLLRSIVTDLGPRPGGSEAYNISADILFAEMLKATQLAEIDRFTFEKWDMIGEPSFIIGGTPVETYPYHGSGSTPEGGINGILVKRDSGAPYGVVDVISGDTLSTVTVSSYGRAIPSFIRENNIGGTPVFNIGMQDEPLLEAALENKTPVRIDVQTSFTPDTSTSNIVGTIPGEIPDEILFLAHYDTVYPSPGANDNTASVITMLMLAHALSGTTPHRTVTFVATGAEEYGYLGAKHYAKRRIEEGTFNDIKVIVNFDSLTYGLNLMVYSDDEGLKSLVREAHQDIGAAGTPKYFESDPFVMDTSPFKDTGAQAVYINSRGYDEQTLPIYHRPEDTAETVHGDCVENSFVVFTEYIQRLQES